MHVVAYAHSRTDAAPARHQAHGFGTGSRVRKASCSSRDARSEDNASSKPNTYGLTEEELIVLCCETQHHHAKHLQQATKEQQHGIVATVVERARHDAGRQNDECASGGDPRHGRAGFVGNQDPFIVGLKDAKRQKETPGSTHQ